MFDSPLALPVALGVLGMAAYVLLLFVEERKTSGGLQVWPFDPPWSDEP